MIYKDVLPNGIRIITEEVPYVHSVSIGIWVGTGSRYEHENINGVSHFLEHMLFKGTKKRTAKQIAETLESVGGQLNAFTTKEYTCYYAKVLNEHFNLASDVLSDMFLHSLFLPKEMEKERNVILEEIKMYEDTPDELVHDICSKILWKNDPLGQSIIGSVDTINQLTRDQLVAYYRETYVPQNMVIVVVGNITRKLVLDKLTEIFLNVTGKSKGMEIDQPISFKDTAFVTKDIEQTHICLGLSGLSNIDKKTYSLHVLNNVLGGGISSRLFQEIRERRGLTYSIYSYHTGYSNTGIMGIYAGTSMENVKSVVEIILRQLSDIKKNGITREELERTKQQIKGNILLGLENISSRMHRIGKSEISLGKIISPEEIVESVMNVTNDSIKNVAQQIFQGEKICLTIVGPKTPDLNFDLLIEEARL